MRSCQLVHLSVVLSAIMIATALPAQQLDRSAVFKTPVPHSHLPIAASPVHSQQATQTVPVPATTFGGAPYTVGPTVTPTTTKPEAEEHIAVDPLNSKLLVAAISDFSLRGGFNTTKYVVSTTNGGAGS